MNELTRANKWLYVQLTANDTVRDIVGTRVYARRPPKDASYPLIVYSLQAGTDVQGVGTSRILNRALYLVKVVTKGKPTGATQIVADALDSVINNAIHVAQDDVLISARREESIEFEEDTPNSEQTYYHLGGLYRLEIREA